MGSECIGVSGGRECELKAEVVVARVEVEVEVVETLKAVDLIEKLGAVVVEGLAEVVVKPERSAVAEEDRKVIMG